MIINQEDIDKIRPEKIWFPKPMRALSKKERIRIYEYALKKVSNGSHEFMCNAIARGVETYHKRYITDLDVIRLFPEFDKHKPEGADYAGGWWKHYEIGAKQCKQNRIEYLNKIINLLK